MDRSILCYSAGYGDDQKVRWKMMINLLVLHPLVALLRDVETSLTNNGSFTFQLGFYCKIAHEFCSFHMLILKDTTVICEIIIFI